MEIAINKHKTYTSGHMKTICVSTVLLRFGIHPSSYNHTWNKKTNENVWGSILRKNGYAVRSRFSQLPKGCTAGRARLAIKKLSLKDPKGTLYIVGVDRHVLLMDGEGNTVVDTDPRKRDRRKVLKIYAVYR